MTYGIINLWWLWLILGIWLPPMLIIGVITTIIKVLSLFDTSELTWEGIKGRPLSQQEKQRRAEGRKELLVDIKNCIKGIFKV